MTLCSNCQRLDLRTLLLSDEHSEYCTGLGRAADYYWDERAKVVCFRHSENILAIQNSALAGCEICGLLEVSFCDKPSALFEDGQELPVVLVSGSSIGYDEEDDDVPVLQRQLQAYLRAFLVHAEEGLIDLCKLELSVDKGTR